MEHAADKFYTVLHKEIMINIYEITMNNVS